jgi:seryl-tRNA synthetase
MLNIKYIRENTEEIKQNIKDRRMIVDVNRLLELDESKRTLQTGIEELRSLRNKKSKGKPTEAEILKMREVGESIKTQEEKMNKITEEYTELLLSIPNKTHIDSPIGGEEDFKVLYVNKEPKQFDFEPKDHEMLMTNLDMIDFERGAKVAGSKFYFAKKDLVKLNRALVSYGIDIAEKYGFELLETPDMAKQDVLIGAGFNPRGEEDQIYTVNNTDFALIGTAEITTLGYHQNEILDLSKGPKKYLSVSHCFRKEAGAYGRTSKGLYRVHQFTKLEMFVFCRPEESDALHEELITIEKEICDGLEIAYRVIDIPTGDLGAPAYRKYDIEAYMTMNGDENTQGGYGEITSTSNCLDYQARRMNIRYAADGKNEFVHTLNGTAVVLSRFPLAVVEQHQQADGSIHIPKVLQTYMGKEKIG